MKACAVIAEFNPFHNGHQYLLDEARKQSGADILIVIMSGNFVQRGEPALVNKWERAQVALENGADLVVEIPTEYVISAARDFAYAGLKIAQALNVDYLAFGSENPTIDFEEQSIILDRKFENIDYRQNFASQLFEESNINQSNDILALNYAYWKKQFNLDLKLLPIQRKEANHQDQKIVGRIASATAIRKNIFNQEISYQEAIPTNMLAIIQKQKLNKWSDFWDLLKYRIITSNNEELAQIKGMNEGFENRIQDKLKTSANYNEFLIQLKTKRYALTTIQRILVNVLLNIKKSDHKTFRSRLLAVNEVGRLYLRQKDNRESILTKVSQADFLDSYQITSRADKVYQIINPYKWGKSPIIKKNVKE